MDAIHIEPHVESAPKSHTPAFITPRLVGREEELNCLRQHLERAKRGQGRFVVITGEAGIGKTLLAESFANQTEVEGVRVLRGFFSDTAGLKPYDCFLEVLKQYAEAEHRAGRKLIPLVSNLLESSKSGGNGNDPADRCFQTDFSRELWQQHIAHAFVEIARREPILLVLQESHLATATTWQFLHYLSRQIQNSRLLVLCTLRQDGRIATEGPMPPYADVLQRMSREDLRTRIPLTRFDEAGTRRVVNVYFLKSDFSCTFIPDLFEISGGNPLFLTDLLQQWLEEGVIYQHDSIWYNRERPVTAPFRGDEQDLSVWSEYYLRGLTPEDRHVLEVASLIGYSFDHRIVAEATGIPRVHLLHRFEELEKYPHVLRYVHGRYYFNHPALRDFLAKGFDLEAKRSTHLVIAQAIERLDFEDEAQKISLLATQYAMAEAYPQALTYLIKAGDLGVKHYAFHEARQFYQKAYERMDDRTAEKYRAQRTHLLLQLAWLDRVLGEWQSSLECCRLALKTCEDIKFRNEALLQMGLTYFKLNEWEEATACFEQCIESHAYLSPFDQAVAKYGLGNIHFEHGRWDEARSAFLEAMRLAKEVGADYLVANLLNNLGAVESATGHAIKAIGYYSQSIPIYQRLGDSMGLARLYNNIGITHADQGEWEKANSFYGKSLSISDRMGLVPLKSATFLNRALAFLRLGRLEEAIEYNTKARKLLLSLRDRLGLAEYYKIRGMIEREQQRWRESERSLTRAFTLFQQYKNALGVAETAIEMGILQREKGHTIAASDWFEQAHAQFMKLGLAAQGAKAKHYLETLTP